VELRQLVEHGDKCLNPVLCQPPRFLRHQRRGEADRGEYRQAAGVIVFWTAGLERPMTRSARVALVAALLFGGTSIVTAKNRGPTHRNPFPPRITETVPRSTGVLPPEQQCGSLCDPYGHAITR
jgi:hypothetical protein